MASAPPGALTPLAKAWVYIRIQLMVFVCGIVGPIFLFLYFAVQPQPATKWMYYAGLIITAVDVLIALGLTAQAVSPTRAQSGGAKTAPPD